jgi:hypothetical protein
MAARVLIATQAADREGKRSYPTPLTGSAPIWGCRMITELERTIQVFRGQNLTEA